MCKHEITFDKLPQAITYLTEQVAELKQLVSELQAPQSEKHLLVGIDDACRIIQKAKPTIYALVRKGILPSYKWKIQCKLPPKTKRFCPLVLK